MGGELQVCFRSADERSGRSADSLGWPIADSPLWGLGRRFALLNQREPRRVAAT